MADKKPKRLPALALAAGLAGGGVAGFVLGGPGISSAQTTTVPDSPTTTAPDSGSGSGDTTPDRPARGDGKNCPDKEGGGAEGSGTGAATNAGAGFRGRGGGRV